MFYFLANYITYQWSWADTIDMVKKKVHNDGPLSHAYMTSIDDIILSWKDYPWYNTGLNPIRPVTFNPGRMTQNQLENLPFFDGL